MDANRGDWLESSRMARAAILGQGMARRLRIVSIKLERLYLESAQYEHGGTPLLKILSSRSPRSGKLLTASAHTVGMKFDVQRAMWIF